MRSQELIQKVIVARSREGNSEFQRRLAELGIPSVGVETIRFEEPEDWFLVDEAINGVEAFDWVLFTSPRGVAAFGSRVRRLGKDVAGPRMAAVGASTAAALEGLGFKVEFVPRDYLTAALGEGLPSEQGRKVLLLRADIGEKELVLSLRRRGFEVKDVAVYRTRKAPGRVDVELLKDAGLVIYASPSEVKAFRDRLAPGDFKRISRQATAACIGPVTAGAARSAGFRTVVVPEVHTVDALVETVRELLNHA
ncbi:MAG: uroporphyrinogen-III synthase [Thaumarchaeota archaeon]|nr:uroporphyrinogen-III synthase [Nitrososphaerota archaeon]